MKAQALIISLLSLVFFTSCDLYKDPSSKEFYIDNPLSTEISIEIDGTELKIPAFTSVLLEIEFGKHRLSYNGESISFFVKKCDQAVVMNPTLSNYIFYNEFYTDSNHANKAESEIKNIESAYLYDYDFGGGEIYKVPFKVVNSLFIEQYAYYWHYGLDTPFPKVADVYEGTTNLSVINKSKLFRELDFLAYAEGMFVEGFRFPSPEVQSYNLLKPHTIVQEKFFVFDCEEAKHIGVALKKEIHAKLDSLSSLKGREFDEVWTRLTRLTYGGIFNSEVEKQCADNSNYYINMRGLGEGLSGMGMMSAVIIE